MRLPALACALLLLLAAGAPAEEGLPVRRHVLALVEGAGPDPETEDVAHVLLELPLNHLGLVLRRHSLERGPPPDSWVADSRAVLTLFTGAGAAPEWLWPWLEAQARRGDLRFVHFGELGPLAEDPARLARWLARFGLGWDQGFARGPLRVQADLADEALCAFEADPRHGTLHRGPWSERESNRIWVTTRDRLAPERPRHPVVTGPWGGLALTPWTLRMGGETTDRRWHLDPFAFFAAALGTERVPAPHPSVLNGRRMLVVHVDGDGFESLSTVRPGQLAAQVMDEEVFARYALPFTVSVIVRSLTPDYAVERPTRAMELARRILNRENVEPASHGVLHTLRWHEELRPDSSPRTIMSYPSLANYAYSTVNEVKESIRFVNERLLRPPRRCAVMLWTGEANPREDAILAAKEMGALNLNGGVFRWDLWHDSVAYVSPWSRRVGAALQVYAGAANENDFEGFYDTMPGAFAHIDQTIERTGTPRVLKPANIYMHFYSAETPARLETIHRLVRRWAFEEETAPVFASTYVEAVNGAVRGAQVAPRDDGWILRDFGGCRTARIDGEPRDVDWRRSRGLLGARRVRGSLYLHLAAPDAVVVLAHAPPPHPHVRQANCLLDRVHLAPTGLSLTARAHHARLVELAGFPPGAAVTVRIDERAAARTTDAQGRLRLELPEPGVSRIAVSLR